MSFPIEEVSRYPLPGMAAPSEFKFSPDDRLLGYLFSPERSLVNRLQAYDTQTGERLTLVSEDEAARDEKDLSLEERLMRERIRQRILGVTRYEWISPQRLLLPLSGDLYIKDSPAAGLRRVYPGEGRPLQIPQASPDGQWVAFVQDGEVFVVPSAGGAVRQLTFGAEEPGLTHGLAEFVSLEEIGRREGFWWSPDSRSIAFTEVDVRHIPVYRIVHQGEAAFDENAQEDHFYPFAGKPNARVRLGVVSLEHPQAPVWMDITSTLPDPQDFYLARVSWFPDGSLLVQVQNRPQTELHLLEIDPSTGSNRLIYKETNSLWINLHDSCKPLKGADGKYGSLIWASERSGFRHLYSLDRRDGSAQQLTSGEWMVDELKGVDEDGGWLYFTGTLDGPTECNLYRVPLAGGAPQRLTSLPGMHLVTLDHACRTFVDLHHSLTQPPRVTLRSLADGSQVASLYAETDPRLAQLSLTPPSLVTLQNRHGDTLYGAIFYPPADAPAKKPYPLLVDVYGGPGFQNVTNGWNVTVDMRAQYLSNLGFLVFMLDNRGSSRRGLAFEGGIKNQMSLLEVQDQVDGVRWLVDRGLADPARVGVYGWSYGGYMTLMCLGQAPQVFKAGVSGAPVTHYDGYDSHYTERYMGTPQENPQGYELSSTLHYVDQMTGSLMIVHGMIDENVHFRNTARLINALIKARKRHSLLIFPDERHMPRRLEDRIFMEENIRDFFIANLS